MKILIDRKYYDLYKILLLIFGIAFCKETIAGNECDKLAAFTEDPNRKEKGVLLNNLNAKDALIACRAALIIDQNNPRFQFQYGRSLIKSGQYKSAMKWLRKASEQQYIAADAGISYLYLMGYGVPKDMSWAFHWNLRPALAKFPRSQYLRGWFYANGKGVSKNYLEAAMWYKYSATNGIREAQYQLAKLYENGQGFSQDYELALQWYSAAAKQGHTIAKKRITELKNKFTPAIKTELENRKSIQTAAENGDANAQFLLAMMYRKGENGISKNDSKAAKWFLASGEQGHIEAQVFLGSSLISGRGFYKDKIAGEKWYKAAAGQGSIEALYELGEIYDIGISANGKNYLIASNYYRDAANKGHVDAQFKLASYYAKGRGVPIDEILASKWYRAAAEQGHIYSQFFIAERYSKGKGVTQNHLESFRWYKAAAHQGEPDSQVVMAEVEKIRKNYTKSLEWYLKSAKQGNARAQLSVAIIFYTGNKGIHKDYDEAIRWARASIEQNYSKAKIMFAGICIVEGKFCELFPKDMINGLKSEFEKRKN